MTSENFISAIKTAFGEAFYSDVKGVYIYNDVATKLWDNLIDLLLSGNPNYNRITLPTFLSEKKYKNDILNGYNPKANFVSGILNEGEVYLKPSTEFVYLDYVNCTLKESCRYYVLGMSFRNEKRTYPFFDQNEIPMIEFFFSTRNQSDAEKEFIYWSGYLKKLVASQFQVDYREDCNSKYFFSDRVYSISMLDPNGKYRQVLSTYMIYDKKSNIYTVLTVCSIRFLGAILNAYGKDNHFLFPFNITPVHFSIILVKNEKRFIEKSESVFNELKRLGYVSVILNGDKSVGNNLFQSEQMGISNKLIIGEETIQDNCIELRCDFMSKRFLSLTDLVHYVIMKNTNGDE